MDKRQQELSNYRLEQAERCVKSAKILAVNNDYKGAANRSYYAIFHCMRSVLAKVRKEHLALQKVVSGLDDLFEHDIKGLDMLI